MKLNIFGVFKKTKYFLGYEVFVDIFGLYLGVISMDFRVFSKGQGTEGGYFLGFLKFQTFFGVPEIPDIFWGER